MQIVYSELYDNKKWKCFPIIQIAYLEEEKQFIPNFETKYLDYNLEEEIEVLHIPFSNGLFSNLNQKIEEVLNAIFDFSYVLFDKNYINKDSWNYLLYTSDLKLPSIEKNIETYLSVNKNKKNSNIKNVKNISQLKLNNYYLILGDDDMQQIINNQLEMCKLLKEKYIAKKTEDEEFPNIKLKYKVEILDRTNFKINFIQQKVDSSAMIISYSSYFKSEIELIYSFLNIIFSSNYNYKLLKCSHCEKFFINTNANIIHCDNCKKIILKSQKEKYEKRNIIALERKINSLYNSPSKTQEEKDEYLAQKKEMKGKYINDEEKLKNWFLSHYKSEKKRKENDYIVI